MKPVRVNFVDPTAYKGVWAIAVGVMMMVAGTTGWQLWRSHQVQQTLRTELAGLLAEQQKLERERQMPITPVINPRANSERAALQLVQRDWNVLFDTLENTTLPGIRLLSVHLDASTRQARLEYELGQLEQGAAVTERLNATGKGHAVWQLERLDGAAGKVRGVWRSLAE